MNQTFYNLVEINRYERDLASDNAEFGNVVFLNRDPREAARQKKRQFESSLPFSVEWEWNGMREETGNDLRHYNIMNQSEARN